jgi:hypothetical protein
MNLPSSPCLALVLAALAADGPPAPDPTEKPLFKKAKVSSVDKKLKLIDVKDPALEVLWDPASTVFFHHRSLLLKDLKEGTAVELLGKLHDERRGQTKKAGTADALITDIEYVGTGKAYRRPPLAGKTGFIRWHACVLESNRLPFFLRIGNRTYKLLSDERTAVHSTERIDPEKIGESIVGKTVFLGGRGRKVTVERDGKERQVTHLFVTDVHLVESSPEHTKVFLSQWGDRKQAPKASDGKEGVEAPKAKDKAKPGPAAPMRTP